MAEQEPRAWLYRYKNSFNDDVWTTNPAWDGRNPTEAVPLYCTPPSLQQIATAPKDGTVVLGYDPNWYDVVTPMFFSKKRGQWVFFHLNTDEIRPTHWMPQPTLPPNDQGNATETA